MFCFVLFLLRWVFVVALRPLVAANRVYFSLRCMGFSLWGLLLLQNAGSRHVSSVVTAHRLSSHGSGALEHRLSNHGTQVYLLRGMWSLPKSGIEPMSPALAGGFLASGPAGKSPEDGL